MRFPSVRNAPDGQPGQRAFPYKLYALLEEAEIDGFAHIISWQPGGTSFRVHQPDVFTTSILPQCFKQSKYKSFLRQLNIYDFHRIQHGDNKDGYCHRFLIRGKPDLCDLVVRVFVPSKKKRAKERRVVATTKPRVLSKDEDCSLPPQPCLDHLFTEKYQACSFAASSTELSVKASHKILCPDACTTEAWLSALEDSDPANTILADLVDPALDDGILPCDEEYQTLTDANLDPGGLKGALVPTVNNDLFSGQEFLSTTLPVRTLVRTKSEHSLASCGSTASSILGSFPNGNGTNHQDTTIPQVIDDSCGDLFGTASLGKQIPWIGRSQGASRSMVETNPNDTPCKLSPPLYLDPVASSRTAPKSSSFPTIEPRLSTGEGEWLASTTGECLEDWSGLRPEGATVSHLNSTDASALIMQNDDLTRSESVFPAKLHRMLQDADREGFQHIVSWIQGGTAFKVHDVESFMRHVMVKYFDQSKYQSFRRQLNLYQFTRVNSVAHGTYYFHKCFLQCDPSLCHQIKRPKASRRSRSQQ